MSDKQNPSHKPVVIDLTVIALVVFLAALLYVFGTQLSGDTNLSDSVRGAAIFDTRSTPN